MDGLITGAGEAINLILDDNYQELAEKYLEHINIVLFGKDKVTA